MSKPGRPAMELTNEQIRAIEVMASRGAILDDIAYVIGFSPSTLDRRLADCPLASAAYSRGRAIAKDEMGQRLWDIAMNDKDLKSAVTASIFWLKAQAGWRDRPEVQEESTAAQVHVYIPDNGRTVSV